MLEERLAKLEAKIETLTVVVSRLTDVLVSVADGLPAATGQPETLSKQPVVDNDIDNIVDQTNGAPTIDDAREVLVKLPRDSAKQLVAKFDANNLLEVDAAKYQDIINAANDELQKAA